MALPSSGQISMNQVNVELGYTGTVQISLNDAAVRTLFEKASGAISMSDGWGKSNATGVAWVYGDPGTGGTDTRCDCDDWGPGTIYVSGTQPIYWELRMYSNGCGNAYAIDSGNSGGTGYNSGYAFSPSNYAGACYGSYTGGATKYKAAHYKVRVWNSVNEILSSVWHVEYGTCNENCTCPCSETCTENCCCYSCDGDIITCCDDPPGTPESSCCRGDCDPGDPGWACGYTCLCDCSLDCYSYYAYTDYYPNGTCT